MKTLTTTVGLVLLLALASTPATATTYKYRDASGNMVYSQNPPENPDTPYEILGDVRSHARPGSNTPASSVPTSSDSQQEESADDVIAKTQQDAEQIREKNCTNAKKNLEIYTVTARVRNQDGEFIRLDDKVRQQKIEEAKQAIRDFCN